MNPRTPVFWGVKIQGLKFSLYISRSTSNDFSLLRNFFLSKQMWQWIQFLLAFVGKLRQTLGEILFVVSQPGVPWHCFGAEATTVTHLDRVQRKEKRLRSP